MYSAGLRDLAELEEFEGEMLSLRFRERFPAVEVGLGYPATDVEIIVNATSLGLKPGDALPLDAARFPLRRADGVYDLVYRPASTPLLNAAREAGCRTANGLGMLLHQGAAALELWTGRPAPLAIMRAALEREVNG